jgi:hypothetical protein
MKCSVDSCSNAVRARGWCSNHWTRWRNHGDPLGGRKPAPDITGARFGRLVVVGKAGTAADKQCLWLCACDCGNESVSTGGNLKTGNTKSCGCLNKDVAGAAACTHGQTKGCARPLEYMRWWGMIARCKYPSSSSYKWYGGKGIRVCDRWQGRDGFANFMQDMGPKPEKGWSIDRIDPSKDYSPSNCRWLTSKENSARSHTSKG